MGKKGEIRLLQTSNVLYLLAFAGYVLATLLYVVGVTGKKMQFRNGTVGQDVWTRYGYMAAVGGVIVHFLAIVFRGLYEGHIPVSNMFEYMSFWAFSIMLAFVVIHAFYRVALLGAFASPVGVVMLAYASVFPARSMPLIPALQSYWLNIHVTTAALGEGILTIGFAAALMYLLRVTDLQVRNASSRFLEFTLYLFFTLLSFVIIRLIFKLQNYSVQDQTTGAVYTLPPIVGPTGTPLGSLAHLFGIPLPLFNIPAWMQGADAAAKFNTFVWSFLGACILYVVLRLLARKPLAQVVGKWVTGLDPASLDELSYRAIAIGYPVFTLGALVFAMIWAQDAWGSYWSWDPKETWALITWLYYTVYLHLRLTKGWEGTRAAWMAVAGFVIILFLLVGVNFMIVGLHSYAGPTT
jgi:ABC-type transport system involved in cytochrome c biogenesis permease subunit